MPGLGLVSAGLLALVWGVINGNDLGWTEPRDRRRARRSAPSLLVGFVVWEARTAEPMLPLGSSARGPSAPPTPSRC